MISNDFTPPSLLRQLSAFRWGTTGEPRIMMTATTILSDLTTAYKPNRFAISAQVSASQLAPHSPSHSQHPAQLAPALLRLKVAYDEGQVDLVL